MKIVDIFTDGACKGNQNENNTGGYGGVLLYKNIKKEISGYKVNTTNNEMELTAMIESLSMLKESNLIVNVYSDSSYIINCFKEKWYLNWQKNNWKTKKKTPVENRELWERLLELVGNIKEVHFFKIKGHLSSNEAEIDKWYKKFIKEEKNISLSEYKRLIEYNVLADKLASDRAMEVKE